ncbi:MAG: response regulator [Mycobacteriales bacterium]|nr:response regulator [Mycobacteriales bacterium]
MRVMTVDDDPSILSLVQTTLELDGHEVTKAVDGNDALYKLETSKPDLIVLDVMMPGKNGWEVLEAIRQDVRLARTPVLLLTARDLPDDVQRGRELGASAVLAKPFEPQQLSDLVAALLTAFGGSGGS